MIKKSFQKQRYFLLLFVFLIITTLCSTNRRKKQKAKNQICACKMRGKIIGGTETKKLEFPWHVGLFDIVDKITRCGGVLITHVYVITAAHCLEGFPCEDFDIILGGHSIDHTSPEIKRIKTEKCIIHPKYKSPTMLNDIGLIKLAEYVVHDEKMSPVCFPRIGTNYTGRTATAIGWGRTKTNVAELPTVLLKINLTIADFNKCVVRYGEDKIDPSMICSTWNDEGKGTHIGDSGSAVMIFDKRKKHYVIGLCSFGVPVNKEKADVFTRVDRYYEWIEEYTGKGELCTGYKA